jgi:hypothetical protein
VQWFSVRVEEGNDEGDVYTFALDAQKFSAPESERLGGSRMEKQVFARGRELAQLDEFLKQAPAADPAILQMENLMHVLQ